MTSDLRPYPEYKDSGLPWCPQVPAHWTLRPNRAFLRQRKVLVGERHSEYTLLSLTKRGVIVRDLTNNKGKFSADMGTFQEVRSGDLVMCLFDVPETPRTVGLSEHHGMITGAYTVFESSDQTIAKWLEAFYIAMDDRKLLSPLYSGLRNTIPRSVFLGTKTPTPPPVEQQTIVRFVRDLDKKVNRFIRNRRRLIEVLNEQKQVIINRAVTRGLDPNAPLKPSGIDWLGNIPKHWELVPLRHLGQVQTGITLGKSYGTQPLVERPYLRVANVQAGRLDLRVIKTLEVPPAEAAACQLRPGDVLMTEGGDIDKLGRGCVWSGEIEECLHQNHIFAVRVDNSRLYPEYLTALMASKHGRTYFEITAKRTTNLAATNSSKIRAFVLPLPPVDEQAQLLAAIRGETETTDALRDRTQREISLIREYRTRLIADVVTGKLDVRGIEVPEVAEEDLLALDEDNGESDEVIDDELESEVEE